MQLIPTSAGGLTAVKHDERRRHERYAVRCECWVESDDASVYGPTADLGRGGVFLRTAVPLEHGHRVEVVLAFEHGPQRVRAHGVVTRTVRAERGRQHGVGIELVEIQEGEDLLARLSARPVGLAASF